MQFDLTDLRLFVAVAEERNLTRAAARQHMSLAAASARIRALEMHAGVNLLLRESRGVRLSPAGESFAQHARAMLREAEQLRHDLQQYEGGTRGQVRVFAYTAAVTDFLPEVLPDFLARHPHVNVDLLEKPSEDIPRAVADGRADIGIVSGPVDTLGLRVMHISTGRLVLVTPPDHPLAQREQVAFAELLGESMVGMSNTSTTQAFLQQQADRLGRTMRFRVQLASFDAVCRTVARGVGIAVIPEAAARRNLQTLGLMQVRLSDHWQQRERYLLTRHDAPLPGYAEALIEAMRDHEGQQPLT